MTKDSRKDPTPDLAATLRAHAADVRGRVMRLGATVEAASRAIESEIRSFVAALRAKLR